MNKSQNYFYFLLIILSTSCSESKNQKKETYQNHQIEITSKNPKAIEFFRKGEKQKLNNELRESKESFLSALRLDPNMVMALIEIPESNVVLRSQYRKKAAKNIINANDFEKIYFAWDTLPNYNSGREKK